MRICKMLSLTIALAAAAAAHCAGRNFADRVISNPSAVYLKGMHTAEQKGPTCNVYSTWMILRYYKYHIKPGQVKKGSYDGSYKTSKFIADKLDTLNFSFLAYHPKQGTDFAEVVKTCIDNGIPLQWGVNLNFAPDVKSRRSVRQNGGGGHARVIWGYERDRRSGEILRIIFADSWGGKHLRKRMEIDEACHMTMSMHPIYPKDTDPEVVAKLLAIPGMKQLKTDPLPDKRPPKKPRRKKRRGKND